MFYGKPFAILILRSTFSDPEVSKIEILTSDFSQGKGKVSFEEIWFNFAKRF